MRSAPLWDTHHSPLTPESMQDLRVWIDARRNRGLDAAVVNVGPSDENNVLGISACNPATVFWAIYLAGDARDNTVVCDHPQIQNYTRRPAGEPFLVHFYLANTGERPWP